MFKKKQTTDLAVVERQIYNLTKLVNINSMINSTLDMGRLLTVIMETIKDIMDTEASTLLLYEEKRTTSSSRWPWAKPARNSRSGTGCGLGRG